MKNGFELSIRALDIKETYLSTFLLGKKEDADLTDSYIMCPSSWKVKKAIYDKQDFDVYQRYFPYYTVWVWLECSKTQDDANQKYDFSELAIFFGVESIVDFSIKDMLESKLKDLRWDKYAVSVNFNH